MLKKSLLHEYQLAIGQILENDPLIHTTFFYDVRFTNNDEIKVHCQNCYCYNSCCCSTSSPKVNSNYNNEIKQLTSDYKECFFKAKLDQIFDTEAYKILNNDTTSVQQPEELEEYQRFEIVTEPIDQQTTSNTPSPTYPKMHVYAPVALYPNEEYYQLIQNEEYNQLRSPQEYQESSQNIELEEQFLNPATAEYPDYQQLTQYETPVYQPFNQQHTSANQFNHITSSAFDQINAPAVSSQLPVYYEYHQTATHEPLAAMSPDQIKLRSMLQNKVPDNESNTQSSIYRSAQALYQNKKRQRTIELQEISPPQKYSKLSIFHSVSSMSRVTN